MDTQDEKDEVKQETAKTDEEIKKVNSAKKEASYKAEPKDAE